jgi:hypothetical protein
MKLGFDREHAPTTTAMLIAVLMMLGALVLMLLPKPKPGKSEAKLKNDTFQEEVAYRSAGKQIDALKGQIVTQTWAGPDQIASAVPLVVSKAAANHSIQLVSMRPQRTTKGVGLIQVGYLINVTGPFKDVLAFATDLDKPDSKLALENVQMGASDMTTDSVNGTIGVDAYYLPPRATSSSSSKSNKKGGSKLPTNPKQGGSNVKA